jgi:hypothetical protein
VVADLTALPAAALGGAVLGEAALCAGSAAGAGATALVSRAGAVAGWGSGAGRSWRCRATTAWPTPIAKATGQSIGTVTLVSVGALEGSVG